MADRNDMPTHAKPMLQSKSCKNESSNGLLVCQLISKIVMGIYPQLDPSKFRQNQQHEDKHQETAKYDFIHVLKHRGRTDVSVTIRGEMKNTKSVCFFVEELEECYSYLLPAEKKISV